MQQHGNCLHGLAKPHVVGQTRTQAKLAQIDEPADAAALIRAQFAYETCWFDQLHHLFLRAQVFEHLTQPTIDIDGFERQYGVLGVCHRQQIHPGGRRCIDGTVTHLF